MEKTAQTPSERQAGLIVREREPLNLEYPFDRLSELFTPNDLFYIRSHFKVPKLKAESYELKIEGAVEHPLSIGYSELRKMEPVTCPATLECAGNGRVFLTPQVEGAQWQLGAVSTANWTGVPLSALLRRAGPAQTACEIIFEAADKGIPRKKPIPPGETRYARSIPVAKAGDVLIAYAMNGEDISADHGFPLRAIVPGYYGMASVKWLTHIRVVTEPFKGYWQTTDYAYWDYVGENPVRLALSTVALKSAIARPGMRELIPAGETYTVFGVAWGGEVEIERIEVTTDGGGRWQPATFLDPPRAFLWRRWRFLWQAPNEPGIYTLKSRATDSRGCTQPQEHDERFGPYVIHHTIAIEVMVR